MRPVWLHGFSRSISSPFAVRGARICSPLRYRPASFPASLSKPISPRPLARDPVTVGVEVVSIARLPSAQRSGSSGASSRTIAKGADACGLRGGGQRAKRRQPWTDRRTVGEGSPNEGAPSKRGEAWLNQASHQALPPVLLPLLLPLLLLLLLDLLLITTGELAIAAKLLVGSEGGLGSSSSSGLPQGPFFISEGAPEMRAEAPHRRQKTRRRSEQQRRQIRPASCPGGVSLPARIHAISPQTAASSGGPRNRDRGPGKSE